MKCLIASILCLASSLMTTAQTTNWKSIGSGTNKRLLSISFPTALTGYISGDDSLLLRTHDGGMSWLPVISSGLPFSLAAKDIVHVNFTSALTGYAIVSNFDNPSYVGTLAKTIDGGITWTTVTTGNIAGLTTFFFDDLNGYEAGSAFFSGHTIMKQAAGLWSGYRSFNYSPQEFLHTVDFHDTLRGITGGSLGYVYRTFDGGSTWDTVKTVTDSAVFCLRFINDSQIIAATKTPMGALIYSNDSGRTWQTDMSSQTFFYPELRSLTVSPRDSFISVGKVSWDTTGLILWWENGAAAFQNVAHPLNSIAMSNDSVAFAVGDKGLIMSNAKSVVSVSQIHPVGQSLQIYPNPAKDLLVCITSVAHRIAIYDAEGRRVLFNEILSREHNIDVGGLARGAYMVEVVTAGGMRLHKKVIMR